MPLPDMLPELPVLVVPLVELVVEPVEPVPEYEPPELPDPIVALVRIHSPPRRELLPDVPVVPVVPLAAWSPRSRHPVTVTVFEFFSLF